ncbi:MAG TPA: serine O-acetyltransferase EpsC [Polyangiales bacterium]|jgi:serine O-acetyltransferase|nr:serine O-acetyltransferase EpsC [Polyangiales bacterium]
MTSNGHSPSRALDAIVEGIAQSYAEGREIDSLESAALPNRRKVIEALHHLEHVAFMGFYSTKLLDKDNLRTHLAEHIHAAAEILTEHIARAVVYGRRGGPAPQATDLEWSRAIVESVFAEIPRLRDLLSMDVRAAYQGDPAAYSIEEIVFSYPGVQAITAHRFAHEFQIRRVPMIPRIMTECAHNLTGIDIHPGATIGRRFFVDHGTGVVIGETTLIGDDVKLYQGVTLGALSMPRDDAGALIRETKRHPTLENGVTIYAGATILGGNTVIGANSVIGANTWITESVPPNTRVSYSAYHARATQRVETRS